MIVSRCCKSAVNVECADEGTAFYVCDQCRMACDTLFSLQLGMDYDTRSEAKTEAIIS